MDSLLVIIVGGVKLSIGDCCFLCGQWLRYVSHLCWERSDLWWEGVEQRANSVRTIVLIENQRGDVDQNRSQTSRFYADRIDRGDRIHHQKKFPTRATRETYHGEGLEGVKRQKKNWLQEENVFQKQAL